MGRFDNLIKLLKRGIATEEDEQESLQRDADTSASTQEKKFGLIVPELTPEREQEMIDQLAARIRKMKMDTPAIVVFEIFRPVSPVLSQLYGFYWAPFMEFFGIPALDYAVLFSKKENVKKLLDKIKEK